MPKFVYSGAFTGANKPPAIGTVRAQITSDSRSDHLEQAAITRALDNTITARAGALAGKLIRVGDGKERNTTQGNATKALKFAGKMAGKFAKFGVGVPVGVGVAAAVAVPVALTMGTFKLMNWINSKYLEPKVEATYRQNHAEMFAAWRDLAVDTVLSDAVIDKLVAHAVICGRTNTPELKAEIREMACIGEHLAEALYTQPADQFHLPLKASFNGVEHVIASSTYTTRAFSWYMMAQTATQDLERQAWGKDSISDMVTDGSIIVKDPGNRAYQFLSSARTCCWRRASHFNERADFEKGHSGMHRGIEDYQNKMPGRGGTLLFNKLVNEELYAKFEDGGMPSLAKVDEGQGIGSAFVRFWCAADRRVHHALSFLNTRGSSQGVIEGGTVRQEHVYKGELGGTVHAEFKALIELAVGKGMIKNAENKILASERKFGMAAIEASVAEIKKSAAAFSGSSIKEQTRAAAVLDACKHLQITIDTQKERLGFASDAYAIARRGAESHTEVAKPQWIAQMHQVPSAQRAQFVSASYKVLSYFKDGNIKIKDAAAFARHVVEAGQLAMAHKERDVLTDALCASLQHALSILLESGAQNINLNSLTAAQLDAFRVALAELNAKHAFELVDAGYTQRIEAANRQA